MQELLISLYPWIKSFHLVLVVAWMAGMMYLPRLFIYHLQSTIGGEAEKNFSGDGASIAQRDYKSIDDRGLAAGDFNAHRDA